MQGIYNGNQTLPGIHGIVHHLSKGGNGLVQRQIATFQCISSQTLKSVVDKMWINLGL